MNPHQPRQKNGGRNSNNNSDELALLASLGSSVTNADTYEQDVIRTAELQNTPRLTGRGLPNTNYDWTKLAPSGTPLTDIPHVQSVLKQIRTRIAALEQEQQQQLLRSTTTASLSSSSSQQAEDQEQERQLTKLYLKEQILLSFLLTVAKDGDVFIHPQQEFQQEQQRRKRYSTPWEARKAAAATLAPSASVSTSATNVQTRPPGRSKGKAVSHLLVKAAPQPPPTKSALKTKKQSSNGDNNDYEENNNNITKLYSEPKELSAAERLELIKSSTNNRKAVSFASNLDDNDNDDEEDDKEKQKRAARRSSLLPAPKRQRTSMMKHKQKSAPRAEEKVPDPDIAERKQRLREMRKEREERGKRRRQQWRNNNEPFDENDDDDIYKTDGVDKVQTLENGDVQTLAPSPTGVQEPAAVGTAIAAVSTAKIPRGATDRSKEEDLRKWEESNQEEATQVIACETASEDTEEQQPQQPSLPVNHEGANPREEPSTTTENGDHDDALITTEPGATTEAVQDPALDTATTAPTLATLESAPAPVTVTCPLCWDHISVPINDDGTAPSTATVDTKLVSHMQACQQRAGTNGQRRSTRARSVVKSYAEDVNDDTQDDPARPSSSSSNRTRPSKLNSSTTSAPLVVDTKPSANSVAKKEAEEAYTVDDDEIGDPDEDDDLDSDVVMEEPGDTASLQQHSRNKYRRRSATGRAPCPSSVPKRQVVVDDLDEMEYEDRVDEWIATGIQSMRDMKERDHLETPPGEEVYDGGLVVPAWINDRLFSYQRTGLQWMWELHRQEAGGMIGDEMVRPRLE
jgi:hypothetical protein